MMNCPNCNISCGDHDRFCWSCGFELTPEEPEKKGSHRAPILVMVILSILGIVVFFATRNLVASTGSTPWFEIVDNTLYFYEEYYEGPAELEVPATVDGQQVLYIGIDCFYDCDSLTTVILPDGLIGIDPYAFESCDRLRGIFIPQSVTFIDKCAFWDCTGLEAIYLSASLDTVAANAFDGCTGLKHVFYPGYYMDWVMLFGADTALDANIYCADGNYWKGIPIP